MSVSLMLFGVQHEFFVLLAFVTAGVSQFFLARMLCPTIAELVAPRRRHAAEKSLCYGVVKECTQAHELADLFLYVFGELRQIVRRHQSVTMRQQAAFAVDSDNLRLAMNCHTGQACQLAIRPYIVVADEEMDINTAVDERA